MKKRRIVGHIITAYAESASGPGWHNRPLWVIVQDGDGKIRQECIQPSEQSYDMLSLYKISEAVHQGMVSAVYVATQQPKRKK